MSPRRLAVLISLIGIGLPWLDSACAQGASPDEAAVRSAFGFDGRDARVSGAVERTDPIRVAKPRAGTAEPTTGVHRHWDPAALGLGRASGRSQAPTRNASVEGEDRLADASLEVERIRAVLGLGPQATVASSVLPRAVPAGLAQRTAKATAHPRTDRDEGLATRRAADADETITSADCAGSQACVSAFPEAEADMHDIGRGAIDGHAPRPERRKRDEPGPMLAEASAPPSRRGSFAVPHGLLIPPDENGPVPSHGVLGRQAHAAADDDPLLALLATLPVDAPPDRSLPPEVEPTVRAVDLPSPPVASAVFERMARDIVRLSDLPVHAVVAVEPWTDRVTIEPATVAAAQMRSTVRIEESEPVTEEIPIRPATLARLPVPGDLSVIGTFDRLQVLLANEGLDLPSGWPGDFRVVSVDLLLPIPPTASAPLRELVLPRVRTVDDAPIRGAVAWADERVAAPAERPREAGWSDVARSGDRAPSKGSASYDIFDPDLALLRGAPVPAVRPRESASNDGLPPSAAPAPVEVAIARDLDPFRSTAATLEPRPLPLDGVLVAIDDARLETMRGGFETDAGLQISFGIERAVYINGSLVTTTSLNVADLSRLTAGQAPTSVLDRATVGLIQSGPNNSFAPQVSSSSVATVIQNSLNNQLIQGTTQINATVNSLDLIRKADVQAGIQSALAGSIRR